MGQHVGTALARILADELEADWDKVRIVAVDTDPKWGLMVTGGSWSVWQTFPVFSRAGAAGRIALIEEGARLLGVPRASCMARNGAVIAGEQVDLLCATSSSAAISRRTFTADELAKLPIKPASERRLIGRKPSRRSTFRRRPTARRATASTPTSRAWSTPARRFRRRATARRSRSIDDSAARSVKGYISSLALEDPSGTVPGWVMVFAELLSGRDPRGRPGQGRLDAGRGGKRLREGHPRPRRHADRRPERRLFLVDDEGLDAAFRNASSTLERTYTTASVLHFQLEPVNALAFEKDGVFEIHTGNQWQSLILPVLAKALGLPEDRIVMRTYLLGGGFGRRLNGDYAVPAALAAKALGKPVKLVLTRPDDARFDSFRSPSMQTLRMAFDDGGKVDGDGASRVAPAGRPRSWRRPSWRRG